MKATIIEGCIACGICTDECPDVFQMGDEFAEVQGEITEDNLEQAKNAESSCPVSVIIIEE